MMIWDNVSFHAYGSIIINFGCHLNTALISTDPAIGAFHKWALTHLLKLFISLLNDISQVEIFIILIPEIISLIFLHLSSVSLAVFCLKRKLLQKLSYLE